MIAYTSCRLLESKTINHDKRKKMLERRWRDEASPKKKKMIDCKSSTKNFLPSLYFHLPITATTYIREKSLNRNYNKIQTLLKLLYFALPKKSPNFFAIFYFMQSDW